MIVTVGVKVVPAGQVRLLTVLSFVERTVGAVGTMRHAHRMLVKGCNRDHPLVVSRMGEVVLCVRGRTL